MSPDGSDDGALRFRSMGAVVQPAASKMIAKLAETEGQLFAWYVAAIEFAHAWCVDQFKAIPVEEASG